MDAKPFTAGFLIFLSTIIWCAPVNAAKEFRTGGFRAGANVSVAANEILMEELTIAGANVNINGSLKRGLNALGANVDISGNVEGGLNAFGANIVLSGRFGDTVHAGAANLVLEGTFEDNLEVGAARLTIMPTAMIKGNLNYASAILDRRPGSRILGQVVPKQKETGSESQAKRRAKGKKVGLTVKMVIWAFSAAALILVGFIVNRLFPAQTESTVSLISASPWKNIGVGFVFLVAVPVAVFIAFITVVGIPAGIIAAFVYGLILYISRIYIGVWIGRKIFGFFKKSQTALFFWPLVAGILTIALVGLVPFVGWLFKLFCLLISLGAFWLALWEAISPRKNRRLAD